MRELQGTNTARGLCVGELDSSSMAGWGLLWPLPLPSLAPVCSSFAKEAEG